MHSSIRRLTTANLFGCAIIELITLRQIVSVKYVFVYNDKKQSFEDLLDGSASTVHRNLRALAVDLFKVFKGLSPVIFAEAFPVRQQSQYNIRNYSYFPMLCAKTVNHELEFAITRFKIVRLYTSPYETDSINEFKHVLKTWKPDLSSCRLCSLKQLYIYFSLFSYLFESMEFICNLTWDHWF